MNAEQGNLGLDEIVSIEEVGIIDTYDFTIPDTHCFFANKILVHNSLEETPDLVILSHWNWFYTKKAEEYNNYDLLIAKNRSGKTGTHKLNYYPEYFRFDEVKKEV